MAAKARAGWHARLKSTLPNFRGFSSSRSLDALSLIAYSDDTAETFTYRKAQVSQEWASSSLSSQRHRPPMAFLCSVLQPRPFQQSSPRSPTRASANPTELLPFPDLQTGSAVTLLTPLPAVLQAATSEMLVQISTKVHPRMKKALSAW